MHPFKFAQSQAFENPTGSGHDVDLDGLAKSAQESFEILERWQDQKSFDHPHVEIIIKKIVQQGPNYYLAIQKSVITADKGRSFASDAIAFCQRLIEMREDDSLDALKRALQDIMQIAKTAHEGSKEMNKRFKRVWTELFQITKEIPTYVELVTSQHAENAASEETEQLVILDVPAESNLDSNEVASSSINRTNRKELAAVLEQFKRATDDLSELIERVASFVDWWGDINMGLANLENILPQVQVDGTNPFRTHTVKERWEEMYKAYTSYATKISEVEDYYKNLSRDSDPLWNEARRRSAQVEAENGQVGNASKTGMLRSINEKNEASQGVDRDIDIDQRLAEGPAQETEIRMFNVPAVKMAATKGARIPGRAQSFGGEQKDMQIRLKEGRMAAISRHNQLQQEVSGEHPEIQEAAAQSGQARETPNIQGREAQETSPGVVVPSEKPLYTFNQQLPDNQPSGSTPKHSRCCVIM